MLNKNLMILFILICLANCYCIKSPRVYTDSKDPKIIALYDLNNQVNHAFSRQDWSKIYDLHIVREYEDGLWKWPPTEEDRHWYINDYQSSIYWVIIDLKMDSYELYGDTAARTINLSTMRIKFYPFKAWRDTVDHTYYYKNNKWYILELGYAYRNDEELFDPEIDAMNRNYYESRGIDYDSLMQYLEDLCK